ncbi:MAG: insulinase family protein [Oscillospiraceae bacterium]
MEVIRKELLPGVTLTAVHTKKFKSAVLAATFLAPLNGETASANALIPSVLRRGTRRYLDMQTISAALDELYGGTIEPCVRKKGETQCVGFVSSFLDDAYTPDGSKILEPAAALLGDLLLHPATEQGIFRKEYVESERENLINRIRAQKNDKRQYAVTRLNQLMCQTEPFGTDKLGCEDDARVLDAASLWTRYQSLLSQSELALYYCGSAEPLRVEKALRDALASLPRTAAPQKNSCVVRSHRAGDTVREFTDRMDVTQGKIALGFRTGGVCLESAQYPALLVLNALYGGSPNSKLFLNVREKQSLCYYASSMLEKQKGVMIVSSGVEFANLEKARAEILTQLDLCRSGNITPEELEAGRRSVVSDLHALLDSQGRLEDYWLTYATAGSELSPQKLAEQVETVTPEEVVAVAQAIELDGVYTIMGKEAQA